MTKLPTNLYSEIAKQIGVAVSYSFAARIVHLYFSPHGEASIFFVASGIALAALLIGGNKYAISVFFGALIANLLSGQGIWSCAATALGSSMGALTGAVLVKRGGKFDLDFKSLNDVARVFVWGGFVGSVVSATFGTLTMYLSGILNAGNYIASFADWWMGDALGVVLMTSVILAWRYQLKEGVALPSLRKQVEVLLIFAGTVTAGSLIFLGYGREIFGNVSSYWLDIVAQGYWMLPFITLAALRLHTSGTTIILLIVAGMGVTGAYNGTGIFATDAMYTHMVSYWFYTVILSLVGMALATYIAERNRTERALQSSETRLNAVLNGVDNGVATLTENGILESFNPSAERMFGYPSQEVIGSSFNVLMPDEIQNLDISSYLGTEDIKIIDTRKDIVVKKRNGTLFHIQLGLTHTKIDNKKVYIGSFNDITERKAAEDEIRSLAFYDTLTKLPNRRLIYDRLNSALAQCKRNNMYGSMMFLDLDNFKPLNDTYGHDVGDILLIEVSKRILSCTREVDTVGRYGGDEFIVILSELHSDIDKAMAMSKNIAEKIRERISEPYHLVSITDGVTKTVDHRCGASIGIVMFMDESKEDIIKWSDMTMYMAKDLGKNNIQIKKPKDFATQ